MSAASSYESQLQLQLQSYGIKPDLDAPGWHVCYFSENDINSRDEEYYFPCSNDKVCCGRECCSPIPQGFPVWLAWLIGILLFLILLLLVACLVYYCWKYFSKHKPTPVRPSPRQSPVIVHRAPDTQTYRHIPYDTAFLRHQSDSNLYEIRNGGANSPSTNTATTVVSMPSSSGYHKSTSKEDIREISIGDRYARRNQSPGRRRRYWRDDDDEHEPNFSERPFVPSPMRETYESPPTPISYSYHDETEITQERRPFITRVQTPDEQKARTMYYRPGSDRVASYNELPKPSENL